MRTGCSTLMKGQEPRQGLLLRLIRGARPRWRSYANFTKHIQRCWAHLLRESKDLAENIPEAVALHNELKGLYDKLNEGLKGDPPPDVRKELLHMAQDRLKQLIEVAVSRTCCNFVDALYLTIITPLPSIDTFARLLWIFALKKELDG